MQLSEQWLRERVNPSLSGKELCAKLTMSGLEVESYVPVAERFTHVVVAEVVSVEKHPEADRLKLCKVDVGQPALLDIVCGAANVKPGMRVPCAMVGATLPNNINITRSKIRGAVSNGMLCSACELSLAEESEGILALPANAPIGQDVWELLHLSDHLMDVSITPNRGDCLSIEGLAIEVAAITDTPLNAFTVPAIPPKNADQLKVMIDIPSDCPRYAGRMIRQVKADAITPLWMQERLRRGGVRCIMPIVDVMNYVMLELGQPMHAFDLDKIVGNIQVRKALANEELTLLDGNLCKLDPNTMVIADANNPLAIAGVMGGLESGVTLLTQHIFLESAYFQPLSIARAVRHYNLGSESSYRFERGIDPDIQVKALERATQLLLEIVGGEPGPIVDMTDQTYLPKAATIELRHERITQILGLSIDAKLIEQYLKQLGFVCHAKKTGWQVTVPARRSDITKEIDLIEEVMRLYGYEKLPTHLSNAKLHITGASERKVSLSTLRDVLSTRGYQEIITYSFVDKKLQALFDPTRTPKELINPITADMAVMRTNLWPGLINTLMYNQHRQQSRVRLFEIGLRFVEEGDTLRQQRVLSGLISGAILPEQWGSPLREVDFFDAKGDLESLFRLTYKHDDVIFKTDTHSALHPGQTASMTRAGQFIGIVGALHPTIAQSLDISGKVFLFELLLDTLEHADVPHLADISKFPEIRRDIAIFVDETVPSQQIQDTIREVGGELLRDVNIFDVYQGKGIAPHQKSIALSLTLQHSSRTLVDEEVANLVQNVIIALKQRFAAELRG